MQRCIAYQIVSSAVGVVLCMALALGSMAFTTAIGSNKLAAKVDANLTRYAVLDLDSNALWEDSNVNRTFKPIGSVRNLMVAYIAVDSLDMDESITVGEEITLLNEGVITCGLQVGDKASVHDLIATMMLEGAQDSAAVLATHIAGSQQKFADRMNETAASLGMRDTIYADPNDETASEKQNFTDLLILASAVLRNGGELATMLSAPEVELNQTGNSFAATTAHRVSMLNENEATFNEAVYMGLGFGSTSTGTDLIFAAKINDCDVLIALGTSLSSRRVFTIANQFVNMLEGQYQNRDCTNRIKGLLSDLEDEGNKLAIVDEPKAFPISMSSEEADDFETSKLELRIRDKTGAKAPGELYATADIVYEQQAVVTLPVSLASLSPKTSVAAGSATLADKGFDVALYTAADETYRPSTYDRYGWIFWSAAGLLCAAAGLLITTKALHRMR